MSDLRDTYDHLVQHYGPALLRACPKGNFSPDDRESGEVPSEFAVFRLPPRRNGTQIASEVIVYCRHGDDDSWDANHCERFAIRHLLQEQATFESRRETDLRRIASLGEIATGRVLHTFRKSCPDGILNPAARDPDCPACRILEGHDLPTAR